MTFTEAVRSVFRNYARFDGRAPRSEYWWFQLFNLLVVLAGYALLIAGAIALRSWAVIGLLALAILLYGIVAFIPSLAVTVRRLHDSDKSGWWLLIVFVPYVGAIILFIFTLLPSTPGMNRFGPPYGMNGDIRPAWYRGPTPGDAWASYTEDARRAAAAGYEPVSQQWRRDAGGDYLEVMYQPTRQQPWHASGWNQMGAPSVKQHPFDGPPPDGSASSN